MKQIDLMSAGTGRRLKEDDTTVNIADLIEGIHAVVNDADPADDSLLGRIKAIEDRLDAITGGASPAMVEIKAGAEALTIENGAALIKLTGSNVGIEEHLWLSTDTAPTPAASRAMGAVIDATTGELTVKYWDGSAWKEVE